MEIWPPMTIPAFHFIGASPLIRLTSLFFFSLSCFFYLIFSFLHLFLCSFSLMSMHLFFSPPRIFSRFSSLWILYLRIFAFFNFGKWSQPICYWVFVEFFFPSSSELFYSFASSKKTTWKNALFPGGNLQLTTVPYFVIRVRKVKFTYNNINKLIIKIVFYKSNFFG